MIDQDFFYADFSYPRVDETLKAWNRTHVPEINDQNPYEPFNQSRKSFSLLTHGQNVRGDIIAREVFPSTCRSTRSIEAHASGAGEHLVGPLASFGEIVAVLQNDYTPLTTIVRQGDSFQTAASDVSPKQAGINFEAAHDLQVSETDVIQFLIGQRQGNFTTNFRAANETDGAHYAPWAGAVRQNDCIYLIHSSIMWTGLDIELDGSSPLPGGFTGVWEFFQGSYGNYFPASVAHIQNSLQFDLSPLLGKTNHAGALVRILHLPTMAYHEGYSVWEDGRNKIVDCSLLGQTDPSTEPTQYAIGSLWNPLQASGDGAGLTAEGKISWNLPQTVSRAWRKTSTNGAEGYAIRFRVTGLTAVEQILPAFNRIAFDGQKAVIFAAVQGRTYHDVVIGSTSGAALQTFLLPQNNVFPKSIAVEVDEGSGWAQAAQVDDFSESGEGDLHFTYKRTSAQRDAVQFGSGINGRRPGPVGGSSNVRASFRVGGETDGNVGPDTITIARTGSGALLSVTNPRRFVGWGPREGTDETEFEIVRGRVMNGAQSRNRGLTAGDIVHLVEDYEMADGSKPIARAALVDYSREEGWATVVCVPRGAGSSTGSCSTTILQQLMAPEALQAIEADLNGDRLVSREGKIFLGCQVRLINFVPKLISVQQNLRVSELIPDSVLINEFRKTISPLAIVDRMWLWRFTGENVVTRDLLRRTAHGLPQVRWIEDDEGLRINLGTGDIPLNFYELPVLDIPNCQWRQKLISERR